MEKREFHQRLSSFCGLDVTTTKIIGGEILGAHFHLTFFDNFSFLVSWIHKSLFIELLYDVTMLIMYDKKFKRETNITTGDRKA